MIRLKAVGHRLIKISSLYMMFGLLIGLVMGLTHSSALLSVHSHVGLLGWATMALAGLVYVAVPRCDGNRLAGMHFWLHNLGLPVMISGLIWEEYGGGQSVEMLIGIGSFVVVVALLLFTLNVFRNAGKA